ATVAIPRPGGGLLPPETTSQGRVPVSSNCQKTLRPGARRLALLAGLPALLGVAAVGCAKEAPPQAAAPEVFVADVVQKDVPVYTELVGQTKGSQDVEIRARVEFYLDGVGFTQGSFVRKGA